MARDILSEYGEDSPHPQAPRAMSGGVTESKSLPYSTPVGPKAQMNKGPGLHGDNCGCCGTQGKH